MRKILLKNVQFKDENLVRQNYNALELSVDYQKDCQNLFNGDCESGGIYIYFQPMEITDNSKSYMIVNNPGFKIRVQKLSRRNQKKIDKVFSKVQEYKDVILDLFIENKRQVIENLVKSFAL